MLLEDLQRFLNPLLFVKNFEVEIFHLNIVFEESFSVNSLGWLSDKNILRLNEIKTGNVIISEKLFSTNKDNLSKSINWFVVENPRKSFADVIEHFFVDEKKYGNIHQSSIISNSVIFNPEKVNIGPNVVIEDNVQLGDFCEIGANTVLKKGIILKSNITIGSNCTIGGVGFGYEQDKEGNYRVIYHIVNVLISDFVEIGNNVCVDRAVIGSTQIGKNVKIDNLVHIAHGVKIDENSLIIANAMIGGSVSIGKNVWVSPSVSIRQKLTIEDDSLVGMGSVVVKDVQKDDIVAGVPAKSIKR